MTMITLIALNWTFYTRSQRYANVSGGSRLSFEGVSEEYRGEIYLPLWLLKNSTNYQFYEMQLKNKELVLNWASDDNIEWMNFIINNKKTDSIKYIFGKHDILQEENCKWNNSVVHYNKENNITTVHFEINSRNYFVSSNIEKQKLIKIIDYLEVY